MRLVGLETATPFLQLGGSVFRGEHVSTLGTELVFHDASPGSISAHVEHKVLFNPVVLAPKSVPAPEPGPSPRDTDTAASAQGGARARRTGRSSGRRGRPRGDETRADL
ncbi:hypothetical protein FS749_002384 [Ceratobasidium sp. UAMH 11750]|nr:hypothetical protein FS749_002384 [Ceratobasidium sp. UAMH 11750]